MASKRAAPEHAKGRALVGALTDPACYDHPVENVRLVETHISWVLLTGTYAYKIKKPVKLPFVDFSTLERRRRFCDEEVRINRRLAADLYLGVVPIGGTADSPRVGVTPAFEYAVKMRQFADDARLDRQLEAGRVDARMLREFAERLAEFHRGLPPLRMPADTAAETRATVERNVAELGEALGASERVAGVRAWTERETAVVAADLEERATGGAHRECHGDLHLENLLVTDGRIVAFDALEFDAKLREIDVISEASFTAMDLLAHRRPDLAYELLNRYFEVGGDYAGLKVLRYYLVYRALVRAKVRAIKAAQSSAEGGLDLADPYLTLAAELCAERRPLLAITHGLSGSGKTHITGELLGRVPALRVRSDLERKRLLGLDATAKTESGIGTGAYDPQITERTYARLAGVAGYALAHSLDIIVDATFLRAGERTVFRKLAAKHGARFAILDCSAPEAVLRDRIAARAAAGRDASEATAAVLDHQLASHEPLTAGELEAAVRVDTASEIDFETLARTLNKHV